PSRAAETGAGETEADAPADANAAATQRHGRRGAAAGADSLHAVAGHSIDGSHRGCMRRLLSVRLRRLDRQQSDPARPGVVERLWKAHRVEQSISMGRAGGCGEAFARSDTGAAEDRRLLSGPHG